jgi:Flp pilus assembly protein TadB
MASQTDRGAPEPRHTFKWLAFAGPPVMDEALEVVDLLADSGLEGAVTWLFRLLGLIAVLAGVGLWLLTDMGLLVVPALLIALGLVLLVAPGILLALAELA